MRSIGSLAVGAGFFFVTLALFVQGFLPAMIPESRSKQVSRAVRTDLGDVKWLRYDASDYAPLERLGRGVYIREGCYAAVANRAVHDIEHLVFFATGVLFWWPIVQPAPRFQAPTGYGARVVYLVLAAMQGALLGLLLAMSPQTWYRAYASVNDQSFGGLVMWALGGAVNMLAVLILLGRYLGSQGRAAPEPSHRSTAASRGGTHEVGHR